MNTNTILLLFIFWPEKSQFLKELNYSKNALLFFNVLRIFSFSIFSIPTIETIADPNQSIAFRLIELSLFLLSLWFVIKKIRTTLSVSKSKVL